MHFFTGLGSSSAILAVLMILTGIFLWQLFTPGSVYRYHMCKKGAISGRTATFGYVPGKYVFNVSFMLSRGEHLVI